MTPGAVFAHWWDLSAFNPAESPVPFYHITDPTHESYLSTVSAATLTAAGIPIPETPSFEEWSKNEGKELTQ